MCFVFHHYRDASPNHLESLKVDSVTVQVNMEEDEVSVLTEEKYNNIPSGEPNTSFMKRKLNDLHDVTSEVRTSLST